MNSNYFETAKHWIDMLKKLYDAKSGVTGFAAGKHREGTKPSPHARKRRQERNRLERQARMKYYKRQKA
jgi:hypothetical protein